MRILIPALVLSALAVGCKSGKNATATAPAPAKAVDTVRLAVEPPELERYNPSRTRRADLIHTRIDISFDWAKARANSKAVLTMKPYFYPITTVELDAKGFDIHKIELAAGKGGAAIPVKYTYDSLKINIDLGRELTASDTFRLHIDYTAKPNEREAGGSAAITSDKGLYFINPLGTDADKPKQIWTQGETEANSAWFPTIDSPNEKMSQDLFITVDKKYVTLSNGTLVSSKVNADGSRTDHWRQELPHAPYLVMMTIGEFEIVKDKWRNKEVNYYMEKAYAPYAYKIFGNTPEMLEFYSKKMGVDYPWDKYSQVIVRDYVSGAMENTSAVIHGDFMNKTDRELLDGDNESIVAHELFHHWFGDLVTCESWANLPLNESFATYGEYLWIEYKYGRDAADDHLQGNLNTYLMESKQKQVDMIRFDYEDKEDMFDSHSYAKGGRILHMLRKAIGDDAFFASLKQYLTDNKYGTAEIHDLRLAFEKVTGEDLNWFFNQWFLASGHPEVEFKSSYEGGNVKVTVTQKQDLSGTPLYRLPMHVDVYAGGKKTRHAILVTKQTEEFSLPSAAKPDLVNIDAEKMLLAVKKDPRSAAEYAFMFRNAPLYMDRYEALEGLAKSADDSLAATVFQAALSDKYEGIRAAAIRHLKKSSRAKNDDVKKQMINLALSDPKSEVRAGAVKYLGAVFQDKAMIEEVFRKTAKDSSYAVVGESVNAILSIDENEALKIAKSLENETSPSLINIIAGIYAAKGGEAENDYFIRNAGRMHGFSKFAYVSSYSKYLKRASDESINKALPVLEKWAKSDGPWYMRLSGVQALGDLYSMYSSREAELKEKSAKADVSAEEKTKLQQQLSAATAQKEKVKAILKKLKEEEKDPNLQKLMMAY